MAGALCHGQVFSCPWTLSHMGCSETLWRPSSWGLSLALSEFHDLLTDLLLKTPLLGASLVAQWLRIRLPMQGTPVRALVWEDLTCHRATGPVSHNY